MKNANCITNRLSIDGKMLAHFPRLNSMLALYDEIDGQKIGRVLDFLDDHKK